LQGRPDLRGHDDNGFLDFANSFADLQFQLAVVVRVTIGVGLLLPKKLEGGTNVVPVFFKNETNADVIAVGSGFAGGFELGVGEFIQSFDLSAGMRVAIEVLLKILDLVGGVAGQAQENNRENKA